MIVDVRVRLLGPVEALVDGAWRPVAGLRRQALLAALALQAREVVSAEALVDLVWDGDEPAKANNSLQSHVSFLRRELALRDVIVGRAPGYVLDLGVGGTDVEVVDGLVRQARAETDPGRRTGLLRLALRWWRGPALAGLHDLSWFGEQAARLEAVRRGAAWALTDARLALGEHRALVAELEHLADQHPLDEELHRQLMLALYRCGRPSDALSAFGRLRRRLAEQLGVDPGPVLRELEASILRHDATLEPPAGGPVPAVDGGGRVLVERSAELRVIEAALTRAATSGSGSVGFFEGAAGIGKSSLLSYARTRAEEAGFNLAAGTGRLLETGHAWGCVRQMFECLLRSPQDTSIPLAGAERATARHLLAEVGPDGEYQFIDSLHQLVVDLAARGPLLVTLDDLQWADPPSARLLAYLAARAERSPVVVMAALRPGVAEIDRIVAGFAQATWVLSPLSERGSAALLHGVDETFASRCHAVARGNPLWLRELGRHVAADVPADDAFERGLRGLRRLLQAQIRQLPATLPVVQAMAVLGGPAPVEAIAVTAGIGVDEALDQLAVLQVNHLVEGAQRCSFAHPLTGEAVYEWIGPAERAALHVRAALVALRTNDVVAAASHVVRVPARWGDVDAVSVLDQAAQVCLDRGSVDDAVVFLRRLLEEDLGSDRQRILNRLAAAEH
ncbi:BTAD domain-containing putative transcriptional regulator [Dactylosporangium sp. AC04546]|uniref:BTAD domain-containing putative transcriptional regulator n=1 Tax=Dactylosporangium sp. AC04546 TaxID=2862460 RepID=UPI001EDE332C|nr:BTAD domain-containing putative transcriptional regulator [Dactylosporangium sp. AC04546]WVK86989.1 BTAD domain-containing putative transcriptional regulator [Dactylosporangium sp. AC04546]